jgi:phosphatidylinositol glycan class S
VDAGTLTDWELDRVTRTRTMQNLVNAIGTLGSLANLLRTLSSIVVKDHIQDIVKSSLEGLVKANESIASGDYNSASLFSQQAIVSAEEAFFDPTMVPLLYFPAEHRLAIYMPFFVPIAIPLFKALKEELLMMRHRIKAQ